MRLFLTCALGHDARGRLKPVILIDHPEVTYSFIQAVSDVPNNTSWCLVIMDTDDEVSVAAVATVTILSDVTEDSLNDVARNQLNNAGFDASLYL